MLADGNETVRERACYALEAFCDELGDKIVAYLPHLMPRLIELVGHDGGKQHVRERSASAIASVAMAASAEFRPYFATTYATLRPLLGRAREEDLVLRARAVECIGIVVVAVGREMAGPVLEEASASVLGGMTIDHAHLRECSYGYFAQLAELLGADAQPLLPTLLPLLLKAAESDDALEFDESKEGGVELLLADDDASEDGDFPTLSVRTGLIDEKTSAIHCIGQCARHMGAAFAPHIERCLDAILGAHDHFHEEVRGASCRALAHLARACAAAQPPQAQWHKGGSADAATLPQSSRALLGRIWPLLLNHFEHDDDKDTVAAASESITELASLYGPPVVSGSVDAIRGSAIALLQMRHTCQEEDGDLDDGPDDIDHDGAMWEILSELLTTLPKVLGAGWEPHFVALFPALLPYLGSSHPASDRSVAIGIVAETIHQMENSAARWLPQVLPLAIGCATDADDASCRQNGVFCLGVLGQHSGEPALPHVQSILSAIQPLLRDDEEPMVRDNAIGALSRLVLGFGAALPLANIMPAILAGLPLTADAAENVPAFRCLMRATHDEQSRALMAPHVPRILAVFGTSLSADGDDAPDAALRAEIAQFVGWLHAQAPDQFRQVIESLPVEARAPFMQMPPFQQ